MAARTRGLVVRQAVAPRLHALRGEVIADVHRAEADTQRLAQAARDAQAEVRALEDNIAERDLVARELARALDGKEQSALKKTLSAMGAFVDCRKQIRKKIVLIDNRVVWSGSLNPLSHTSRTDEFMTRALNSDYAEKVAAFISKRTGARAAEAGSAATEAENPRCFSCGSRTFYANGPYGPYLSCEDQTGMSRRMLKWEGRRCSP